MLTTLKRSARNVLQDTSLWDSIQHVRDGRMVTSWEKAGRPSPPPHAIKRQILSTYAAKYGVTVLVETGTCIGDMVYAMKDKFEKIYSIELGADLANKATQRFHAYQHIQIICGDSANILPQILSTIHTPCLFWLDGHYSEGFTAKGRVDTPIMEELSAILLHQIKAHVILIDDARCFDGTAGYPKLDELRELVVANGSGYQLSALDDVIRIIPRSSKNSAS